MPYAHPPEINVLKPWLRHVSAIVRHRLRDHEDVDPYLGGACAIVSWAVCRELRRAGVNARFVCGSYDTSPHCWVEAHGHVIDLTATQFEVWGTGPGSGGKTPAVCILSLLLPRVRTLYRSEWEGREALAEVWDWGQQSPHRTRLRLPAVDLRRPAADLPRLGKATAGCCVDLAA